MTPVRTFEWDSRTPPARSLILAMSALEGDDPDELEPLYPAIDPDALNGLFAPTRQPDERVSGRIEFDYRGYRVVISASGKGYIYEQREGQQTVPGTVPQE